MSGYHESERKLIVAALLRLWSNRHRIKDVSSKLISLLRSDYNSEEEYVPHELSHSLAIWLLLDQQGWEQDHARSDGKFVYRSKPGVEGHIVWRGYLSRRHPLYLEATSDTAEAILIETAAKAQQLFDTATAVIAELNPTLATKLAEAEGSELQLSQLSDEEMEQALELIVHFHPNGKAGFSYAYLYEPQPEAEVLAEEQMEAGKKPAA